MKRGWAIALLATLAACGGKTGDDSTSDGGGGGDGGACCPPSAAPACCMSYGGWSGGASCGAACDGMASPGDPGWHLGTDSHGCSVWIQPTNPASKCGEPPSGCPQPANIGTSRRRRCTRRRS